MNKKMVISLINAIGVIGGISSFMWLCIYDWKLAIVIFFILWLNNISQK